MLLFDVIEQMHEDGEEVGNAIEGRFWCFTWNNPELDTCERVLSELQDNPDVTYIVAGQECGEGGTEHLQGYIELRTKRRRRTVSSWFNNAVWLGRRYKKSSGTKAAAYCKKDGAVLVEAGEVFEGEQGRRTDLDDIKERLDSGESANDIAETNFSHWCYHRKAFAEYEILQKRKNATLFRPNLEVVVLWGLAGSGKTRYVKEKESDLYIQWSAGLKWFGGYCYNDAALLDDYRGGADPSFFLRLLDIYAFKVPIKGGSVDWCPKRIYITSNKAPDMWHSNEEEFYAALHRRFCAVVKFERNMTFEEIDSEVIRQTTIWRDLRGRGNEF